VNNFSLLEILVMFSATIQIIVLLLSVYVFLERDKSIWIWAVIPFAIMVIRRVFAMFRCGAMTLEIEYGMTILMSVSLLVFLIKIIVKDLRVKRQIFSGGNPSSSSSGSGKSS
jgi:hypothetical protein